MDLSLDFSVKNNLFETNKNNLFTQNAQNSKAKSNIVIVKKGEAGYLKQMDEDEDGEVSLEEFNKYCEENGVDEKHKLALLQAIQNSKQTQQIHEKSEEQRKEAQKETSENEPPKIEEENNQIIYAKKGDDKYNEAMDENKNDIVTYEEYIKYCSKREEKNKKEAKTTSKAEEEYSKSDDPKTDEAEYKIEVEA